MVGKLLSSQCLCTSVRQLARRMTASYEAHLSPYGVSAPQFSILQRLHLVGPIANLEFAQVLGMDRSTLSRGLKPLIGAGWVETIHMPEGTVIDKRSFGLQLTAAGVAKYRAAYEAWIQAQVEIREKLGSDLSSQLLVATTGAYAVLES